MCVRKYLKASTRVLVGVPWKLFAALRNLKAYLSSCTRLTKEIARLQTAGPDQRPNRDAV